MLSSLMDMRQKEKGWNFALCSQKESCGDTGEYTSHVPQSIKIIYKRILDKSSKNLKEWFC